MNLAVAEGKRNSKFSLNGKFAQNGKFGQNGKLGHYLRSE